MAGAMVGAPVTHFKPLHHPLSVFFAVIVRTLPPDSWDKKKPP